VTSLCRQLGYKVKDGGGVEKQDDFLKRMSGTMRLYAAITITPPPPTGRQVPHPHGLEQAWRWLARLANQPPRLDTTATALHDLLDVAGHALMATYGRQFLKVIQYLHDVYLAKVKAVTLPECMGPVLRLENWLKQVLTSRRVAPPSGLLPHNFWQT
jgi:nucleoporin GLE1